MARIRVWIEQGAVWNLLPEAQEGFRRVVRLFNTENQDLFVTSGAEGDHLPHSFHFSRRAWDQRIPDESFIPKIREALKYNSKYIWQVISHGTWCHVELDTIL